MNDNNIKSSKSRQISSKAPPQIVNFFSKPLSPTNDLSPSTSSPPPSSHDRKRKLSKHEASSQNESPNTYAETLQKDAAKISKIQKTKKKVTTVVSAFFQQAKSDDLDFESPQKKVQFKTPPVIPKKRATRKRKLTANQSKAKDALETEIFEKVLVHHSSANGLSSDDLQMALALSRSLTDKQSSNGECSSITSPIRNAEPHQKADVIRQTFQRFGFKKKDNNDYDYRDFYANFGSKRKWLSKFTPLTRRSECLQKEKFKTKVKNILRISEVAECVDDEMVQEYILTSSYLQQFFTPKSPTYQISLAETETKVEDFYVNNLVPISTLQCGCLLKSWADIPGRDVSPQREVRESCNVDDATISSEILNETSSIVNDEPKQNENVDLPQCEVDNNSERNSQQGTDDPVDNPETSSNVDDKNEIEVHQENGYSGQTPDDDLAELTDPTLTSLPNVNLTNERVSSPDMFADYESSANNSLNDDVVPVDRDRSGDEVPKGFNSDLSYKLECKRLSFSQRSDENFGSPLQPKVIVLSSDDSNHGCVKIVETKSVNEEQKLIDHPLVVNIAKKLSFTERLRLYNSDPALEYVNASLGTADEALGYVSEASGYADDALGYVDDSLGNDFLENVDNDLISSLVDPSSQDSIVISDDEINYSSNHCTADGDHGAVEHRTSDMPSQESIVLSDSADDQNEAQSQEDDAEERQSFASIEMDNGNDFGNEIDSFNDDNRINLSVQELCRNESRSVTSAKKNSRFTKSPTANVASQESIVLSDSDDQNEMASQLVEDEIEERHSFASIEIGNGNDTASEKSLDINIDDDMFNSKDSLADEDLINISVREMFQNEFVSGSAKASFSTSLSRTTSDMTFERKMWKPPKTPNNFSDDEFDEFDKLVRGNRSKSPIPTVNSIEISDDELDQSLKSLQSNVHHQSISSTVESNEFIVQSMDQIYEVRTGRLVSPKPDYERMDSPTRLQHLKKFGLKTLSKRKAVICLEHIYNRLHPFIELDERDDLDDILSQKGTQAIDSNGKRIGAVATSCHASDQPIAENHFDILQENEEVFYLPSAPRAKKPWCLEALHVAWHNLMNSNAALYDAVLQYKPIDITDIRTLLKSIDLRFETNDIISFLDRKCITFKTENKRNNAAKKK